MATANHKEERRQFSRVEFDAQVTLTQDGREFVSQLMDISLNGLLVTTPQDYHLRTDLPCSVIVHLAEDVKISMQAAFVHASSKFLGFHCTSIDMDSVIHLRRLMEINLQDPAASERVLAELLKRHSS